jgi:5S rRNA maturation endonuclease (ribonuclease M5)
MNVSDLRDRLQGVSGTADKFVSRCPGHDDQHSSLSVGVGAEGRLLLKCHAGCETEQVVEALGLRLADLMPANGNGHAGHPPVITQTYDYHGADGRPLFQVCRLEPKTFLARLPGSGTWGINGVPRVPYKLPELLKADPQTDIFITEGEKDCDNLRTQGLTATCNPFGAGKWREEFNAHLKGRHVVILPDHDSPGQAHAQDVAGHLHGIAASIKVVRLFDGPVPEKHGKDVSDWLQEHDPEDLVRLVEAASVWTPAPTITSVATASPSIQVTRLPGVVETFRKWLYLPDPDPLYATFGAIAANCRPGDPVWLMLVAPSSMGKSEFLGSTSALPNIHQAATITEASLLSGTPRREAKDAKGGLLREIGTFGIIVCKDFGSILNMSRDPRASVLAALREIYDGSWTRHVGTDGGKSLHWAGKIGFIGGCTPGIDRHHAVMSSMGERFCFVRLPGCDDAALARRALEHAGKESVMRGELTAVVSGMFRGMQTDAPVPEMTPEEKDRLVALTTLSVRCRSTIERDSYSREIELVPGAESPGRLTRVAANLLAGLHVIGLERADAWRVVRRVIFDSMPMLRRKALEVVGAANDSMTSIDIAVALSYPTGTARRQMEELAAYGVVERLPQGKGKADSWTVTEWTRNKLTVIGGFPEKSEGMSHE